MKILNLHRNIYTNKTSGMNLYIARNTTLTYPQSLDVPFVIEEQVFPAFFLHLSIEIKQRVSPTDAVTF